MFELLDNELKNLSIAIHSTVGRIPQKSLLSFLTNVNRTNIIPATGISVIIY